jgi:hypothetical protein
MFGDIVGIVRQSYWCDVIYGRPLHKVFVRACLNLRTWQSLNPLRAYKTILSHLCCCMLLLF